MSTTNAPTPMGALPLDGGTSNEDCLRLVEAVRKAMAAPHGDFIDQGLALVRVLAEAGYRIVPTPEGR